MRQSHRTSVDRPADDPIIERSYEPDAEAIARAVAILLRGTRPRDDAGPLAREASHVARAKDASVPLWRATGRA